MAQENNFSDVITAFASMRKVIRGPDTIFDLDIRKHHRIFVGTHKRDDRFYVVGSVHHAPSIFDMGVMFHNLGYTVTDYRDSDLNSQAFSASRRKR